MMSQLTLRRGPEVVPAAAGADWQRRERTHLENLWQDTVEPFRVIGDAWKNDRQRFTQETLRAINLAFNPVLKDEKGKYHFNGRALVYWSGLAMIGLGLLSACKTINNSDGGGITPGPKTPTPESLCPNLLRIAAANSVDVAVPAAAWQAADQAQLRQDLACFVPQSTSLTVGEILTVGQNAGSEVIQLAWARGGEVVPLLAVPGAQVDDLQLVQFFDPKASQWEALSPDQARTQLAAVNINSATGDIEAEESGAMITATRDFNQNISFQIVNPDGTVTSLSQDQVRNNLALAPWLTQVENLLTGQEMLSFDVVPGVALSAAGEKYSLPQDIFAAARERQLAPIEAEGSIAAACDQASCTVMLTDVLVSGAKLQPASDGKVIYGFDGQAGSEALFRFNNLPEGVRATAFVAQEGNPWGFKPGTVVVWFWEGGSKGPATILNPDNPLQIMADTPNSISLTAIDNGLRITRTGPDGVMIDEQTVAFPPPEAPIFTPEGFQISELGLMRNPETGKDVIVLNPEADWQRVREGIIGGLWQANVDWYQFTGEGSDALNYSKENFIKAALEGKTFKIGIPVRANIDWDNFDLDKYANSSAYNVRPSILWLKMVEARLDDIKIQILDPDAFKNYLGEKDWWGEGMEVFAPYAQHRSESPISATCFSVDDDGELVISTGSYYFLDTRPVPIEFWLGRFNSEAGIGSEADQAVTLFLGKTIASLENFSAGELKLTGLDGTIIKYISLSRISQDVVWEKWYLLPQLFIFSQ